MSPLDTQGFLARLVAWPTVGGSPNLDMVTWIEEYVAGPGVRTWRDVSADGSRANLLIWKGPQVGSNRAGLTLSGHLDVVPAEEAGWSSPPFVLTETADGLTGRGAVDMKGFVALAVNLLAAMPAERMTAPLALVLTYDEEVGTVGARELVERGGPEEGLPRDTVIGEPSRMAPVRLHKGHLKMRLTVRGRSAHSGYPHLGASAILPAARAVTALGELGATMMAGVWPQGAAFVDAPFPALNVGLIRGGSAVNVVPDLCTVDFGIRTLPGDPIDLAHMARETVAAVIGGGVDYDVEDLGTSPPLSLAHDAPIARDSRALLGVEDPGGVSYATDAGWLQHLGLDCLVCGPGDIARAHRPNEYITAAELETGRRFLEELAAGRCFAPAVAVDIS